MNIEYFDDLMATVAEYFGEKPETLLSISQRRGVVDARQVLFYLCHINGIKTCYIQSHLEDRGKTTSHSNIIHGINRITKLVKEDDRFMVRALNQLHDESIQNEDVAVAQRKKRVR